MFAFPLQVGAVPYGVLTLYRGVPAGLTGGQWTQAVLLANAGSRLVVDDFPANGTPTEDLFTDMDKVAQATGMVAVQREITVLEALLELRAAAFAQGRPVTDIARAVLAGRISFTP